MRFRHHFPRSVAVHEVWIPMPDGVRLHARIWLPDNAKTDQVPALLEYLPYRKGDWTAHRDHARHAWYAGHGYASARVDIRGTGNSEGLGTDEYSETELNDGLAVIQWLATQEWSTGNVGMFGISWGGFNSLQLAALAPEPLKAIVTVCSSDDRYTNDVHYLGGAVLGVDMVAWAGTMLAFNSRPPDPSVVGAGWREQWRQRIEAIEPFATTWLSHQERDAYWRRGSVNEDYSAIKAAVFAVGGFADPYRDTVLRLVQNLPGPVHGLLGPWAHRYPDIESPPGPAIGFLQETLQWWEHWLKGAENDVPDWPAIRTYLQDAVPPATVYETRPGRWLESPSWPPPELSTHRLAAADLDASQPVDDHGWIPLRSPQHTGLDAGRYFPFGNPCDLPPDQRSEDGRSLTFDTPPLDSPLAMLGNAQAHVRLQSSTARANLIVRLCDVAPDGSSTCVTRGVLNLTKRDGWERADDLVPEQTYDVDVSLCAGSYVFPPGHRLRVALSSSYWPWVWPTPHDGQLLIDPAHSYLEIPKLPPELTGSTRLSAAYFDEPENAAPLPSVEVEPLEPGEPPGPERLISHDVATGEWRLTFDPGYSQTKYFADGLIYDEHALERYSIGPNPLSAAARSDWRISIRREEWATNLEVSTRVQATAENFIIASRVHATDADGVVASREWLDEVPRTSC